MEHTQFSETSETFAAFFDDDDDDDDDAGDGEASGSEGADKQVDRDAQLFEMSEGADNPKADTPLPEEERYPVGIDEYVDQCIKIYLGALYDKLRQPDACHIDRAAPMASTLLEIIQPLMDGADDLVS